jgi:hypothetical protein
MVALNKDRRLMPIFQTRQEKARRYAQELRDLRRRLNIMPAPRIPYDVAKS